MEISRHLQFRLKLLVPHGQARVQAHYIWMFWHGITVCMMYASVHCDGLSVVEDWESSTKAPDCYYHYRCKIGNQLFSGVY